MRQKQASQDAYCCSRQLIWQRTICVCSRTPLCGQNLIKEVNSSNVRFIFPLKEQEDRRLVQP